MTKGIRKFSVILIIFIPLSLAATEEQTKSPIEILASSIAAADTEAERSRLIEQNKSLINSEFIRALIKETEAIRLRGEYDKALSIIDIVIHSAEQINDRQAIATAYNGIAIVRYLQNDYKRAEEANQKSFAISEELQDKSGIANSYDNFGMIVDDQGKYDQALMYHRKSLALRMEVGDKRKIAFSLNNIGKVNFSQGDYQGSLDNFNRALNILEELKDIKYSSSAHNNLGAVYERLGNFSVALEHYSKSLKLREELGMKPGIASCLGNIGLLNFHQGNYDAAVDSLKKALLMEEELKSKRNIATELTNLGDVYQAMKEYATAMQFYERSLKIREELSDKEGIGETLNAIGKIYYSQKNEDRALQYFEKSLAVHESIRDNEGIAVSLLSLAEVDFSKQKYSESLDLANKVESISKQLNLRDPLWQANTITGKAYQALGKQSQAAESFEEAIGNIESLRSEVAGDEIQNQNFLEDKLAPYHSMIELQISQQNFDAALGYAERVKARILADVLKSGKINVTKNLTEEERQEERNLKNQLISLNSQLLRENQKDQPDEKGVVKLKAMLEKTHLDYESFHRNLFSAHHELKVQRGELDPVQIQDAFSLLPNSRSAILEFVVTERKTFLFVLTKENQSDPLLNVYTLPIQETDLIESTKNFREKIANREIRFRDSAKEMYQLLIQPAVAQLKDHSELIIVPDSILWELPFQALVNNTNRYLTQEFIISYAPSLSVLKEIEKPKNFKASASNQLLAFGNPAIEIKTKEQVDQNIRGEKLENLPEAEKEVKTLAKLYGSDQSKVYFGKEAQEGKFKSDAAKYQVLHLATHGILNDANPMYSQVVFALNGTNGQEDGLLEAWEIVNLDLNARLVVLSACETALGRVRKGEGMIGLTWALFVAGTPSTVVSQWKVESDSTTQLMLEFHKQLKQQAGNHISKASALQSAALKLMKNEKYRHPFYWAPFVLIGDAN
jgi:CHAT domain-containing protein/Flp pilus assembly protein TadD